jgi:hypothetical protein
MLARCSARRAAVDFRIDPPAARQLPRRTTPPDARRRRCAGQAGESATRAKRATPLTHPGAGRACTTTGPFDSARIASHSAGLSSMKMKSPGSRLSFCDIARTLAAFGSQ